MTFSFNSRRHAVTAAVLGTAFFAASAGLTAAHVLAVSAMRDVGLPVAARIPVLAQRKAALAEQADIAALRASVSGEAYDELYRLYVLPDKPDLPRVVSILEKLLNRLETSGTVRELTSILSTEETNTITIDLLVAAGKSSDVIQLIDLSGMLTISDALTPADHDALLALTEQEDPSAIVALEQFLTTDLLRYASEPQASESQLLRAGADDVFRQNVLSILDASRLRSIAATATFLANDKKGSVSLWPLPLLTIESVRTETTPSGEHLTLTVRAHGKTNS